MGTQATSCLCPCKDDIEAATESDGSGDDDKSSVSGEEASGVTKSLDAKNTVEDELNSIFTKSGTGQSELSDISNDGSRTIASKLATSDFSKMKGSDVTMADGASDVTMSATLVSNGEFTLAESK